MKRKVKLLEIWALFISPSPIRLGHGGGSCSYSSGIAKAKQIVQHGWGIVWYLLKQEVGQAQKSPSGLGLGLSRLNNLGLSLCFNSHLKPRRLLRETIKTSPKHHLALDRQAAFPGQPKPYCNSHAKVCETFLECQRMGSNRQNVSLVNMVESLFFSFVRCLTVFSIFLQVFFTFL